MMQSKVKKAMHAGFAVVGAGLLVATHVAAGHEAGPADFDEDHPNPGLADGRFSETRDSGPVRSVTIYVADGRMIDIRTDYNSHNRKSHALNTTAVAQLRAEALEAQSADELDLVTGATVTAQAFIGSLQDAINQARQ